MHAIASTLTRTLTPALCLAALLACSPGSRAADIVATKRMTLELAADIAHGAVHACRDQGWQVAAVVVDRAGVTQALLRDINASRFTIQIATDKANAVILSGVASAEFRRNREDIRQEMNQVDGILMLEGGLPIRAAGTLVGAVGVSGAPGGDKDEACARAALESVQERLEFAD
jgi:uncharacterized protein GlcG (DUF336 family)